jgi:hypothetical protein
MKRYIVILIFSFVALQGNGQNKTYEYDDINQLVKSFIWVNGSVASTNSYTYDETGNRINMAVTLAANPLPLDLFSFEANRTEEIVNLNWQTSNEKNFSHFEVTRSNNAKEFTNIGRVEGAKNGGKYIFVDNNPIKEAINYYQLRMVDSDGTKKLTKIIAINFDKNAKYLAVQNPAENGEFVALTNIENPNFVIVNTAGNKIDFTASSISANQFSIKISQAVKGIYVLFVELEDRKVISKKVVIL